MNDRLEGVLADLAAENDRLEALVVDLPEVDWRRPTPAEGWDVATQVAHLAWTDEAAVLAATDHQRWETLLAAALEDSGGLVDGAALEGGRAPAGRLLERWRTARRSLTHALRGHPAGERMPWFGPPMSATSMATARFMETWAHSRDVHDALGAEHEDSDRIRHVAHLGVRTRDFAFAANGLDAPVAEFRVELTLPSGDLWSSGAEDCEQGVQGSALDFCLLVTQRLHREDARLVAQGRDANAWLGIAQCFAGPPGPGRSRR